MVLYPAKSEEIRWIERKEGVIVLNPVTGKYTKLNETASYVWQISNGINRIDEIIKKITCRYNITVDKVKKDLLHIMGDFKKLGIIVLYRKPNKFYHSFK